MKTLMRRVYTDYDKMKYYEVEEQAEFVGYDVDRKRLFSPIDKGSFYYWVVDSDNKICGSIAKKHFITVTAECIICGKTSRMLVPIDRLERLKNGELVQSVFNYISPAEREYFFISRICTDCWDELFEPSSF